MDTNTKHVTLIVCEYDENIHLFQIMSGLQ
jgi:hypothetical protein